MQAEMLFTNVISRLGIQVFPCPYHVYPCTLSVNFLFRNADFKMVLDKQQGN